MLKNANLPDFDGCMHRAGPDKIMFEHIDAFVSILPEYANVEVVISSSWREEQSFDEMRSYFADDVQHQIIDVTPVLDDDAGGFPASWPLLLLCDPSRGFDVEKQGDLRRMLSEQQKSVLLKLSVGEISLIEATVARRVSMLSL